MRFRSSFTVAAALGLSALAAPAADRPNVVFMMADDLGWNDVSYHGSEIRTPNVDSIAKRGVELDRYYAYPVCSPTRAALMTGRIPLRFGVDRPLELRNGLPLDERLLPQVLKEAGYETAVVGKWHLGLEHVKYHPYNRGFDHSYGHLGPAVDYFAHIWNGGYDWHRNGKLIEEEGYTTRLIGDEAVRLIEERDAAKSLFLYIAFNAPHSPLQAPEETIARYSSIESAGRRTYAAMVDEMDTVVGRILSAIEAEGMAKETLIIWCSDNGGDLRLGADNAPLRGGKGGTFEGGIRVPAAAWLPGEIEGGRKLDQVMTVADWLPTIAAGAEIDSSAGKRLDGLNMWPALTGRAAVSRSEPFYFGVFSNVAVIDGDWKYVESATPRGARAKYLFNIADDPEEKNDLSSQQPAKLEELAALMRDFPRAPTVALDNTRPRAGRRRGGKKGGGGPGRGSGPARGWKEITRAPWLEAAKKD